MFNLQRLGAAAAVLVSAVTPVHAASSASASIGPLTIQLFDLAPLDGITPSISFLGIPSESAVQASASQSLPYTWQNGGGSGLTPWKPVSTTASAGAAWSHASISGSGKASGATLSAFGSAADFTVPDGWAYASFSATAKVPTSFWESFTLSANTLLLISGQAWVEATATVPPGSFLFNQASASVTLQLSGSGASGHGSQSSTDGLNVSAFAWGWPDHRWDSGLLAASFVNATSASMSGQMNLSASVNGTTYATLAAPIPEPATWGMLLAGLGAVGFVARRRRG